MGSSEVYTWATADSHAALPAALWAGFLAHRKVSSDCQYSRCLSACNNRSAFLFLRLQIFFFKRGHISKDLINLVWQEISPKRGKKPQQTKHPSHVSSWCCAIQFQRKHVLLGALRAQFPINTTNKNVIRNVVSFSPSSRAFLHSSPAWAQHFRGCS